MDRRRQEEVDGEVEATERDPGAKTGAGDEIKYWERGGRRGGVQGESLLAVGCHLSDKSSSYMIWFAALAVKASSPAPQSHLPCVSPLLPQAGMVVSAQRPTEGPERALCSKQCYKSAHNGWSSLSCVHSHTGEIRERTFNAVSSVREPNPAEGPEEKHQTEGFAGRRNLGTFYLFFFFRKSDNKLDRVNHWVHVCKANRAAVQL